MTWIVKKANSKIHISCINHLKLFIFRNMTTSYFFGFKFFFSCYVSRLMKSFWPSDVWSKFHIIFFFFLMGWTQLFNTPTYKLKKKKFTSPSSQKKYLIIAGENFSILGVFLSLPLSNETNIYNFFNVDFIFWLPY